MKINIHQENNAVPFKRTIIKITRMGLNQCILIPFWFDHTNFYKDENAFLTKLINKENLL